MSTATFRSTAVVGAGAVGGYFGAMLARAGHQVTLVARRAQVDAIGRAGGIRLQMGGRLETVPIGATTDLAAAVAAADLVLVAVKSTDTDSVARDLAAHVAPSATVLSLQNGVENAATLASHVACTVVPAVVYVATAMPEPGLVAHFGRGDLVIGARDAASANDALLRDRLQVIVEIFTAAQVPVRVSADVMAELWSKLMVNCAYNAISALAQSPYGRMTEQAAIRELQEAVVREVVAVARTDGVALELGASLAAMRSIAGAMPAQLSSTAQDLARGKPSEIDHLNGFVARRGLALGIATPVNQALHALVRLVEAERRAAP